MITYLQYDYIPIYIILYIHTHVNHTYSILFNHIHIWFGTLSLILRHWWNMLFSDVQRYIGYISKLLVDFNSMVQSQCCAQGGACIWSSRARRDAVTCITWHVHSWYDAGNQMMPDDPFAHILAFPLSFQVLPLHRKHPRHAWHASALYFSDCFPRPSLKQTIYGSRPEGCMPPCLSKFQLIGPSMSLHTLRFLRLFYPQQCSANQ